MFYSCMEYLAHNKLVMQATRFLKYLPPWTTWVLLAAIAIYGEFQLETLAKMSNTRTGA